MKQKTLLVAAAFVVLVAACGGVETSPTVDQETLDAAAAELTVPPSTAAATDDSAVAQADEMAEDEMAEHDDEMADHDDEMADHDDETADHEDGMAEHSNGEANLEATGEPTMEIDLVVKEFEIAPNPVVIPSGSTVRIHVTNEGTIPHEFRLSNEHRVEEHIAAGHTDHGDEEGHHGEDGDFIVLLEAGETRTVDVTFPADTETFTMVTCLVPGHYESGMFAPIEYQ